MFFLARFLIAFIIVFECCCLILVVFFLLVLRNWLFQGKWIVLGKRDLIKRGTKR